MVSPCPCSTLILSPGTTDTIPNSGREYGSLSLQDGTELPEASLKEGWLRVREDAGKKEESEQVLEKLEKMRSLEAQAKSEDKGLHAGTGGSIEVQNDIGGPEFLKEWKGKTVDGVVERVISGDRLLIRLMLTPKKHWQVMTLLAGIRTPSTERTAQGKTLPAEEYGKEAKDFVQHRLLQRAVKVKIVGASPQGQLVATVLHPKGNISEFLLLDGLARCNDFHSTMLGGDMAKLRAAEQQAQAAHLRLHKNHVAKSAGSKDVESTVTKIIAADTIIVRNKAGAEKRISLSSVRAPRGGEPSEAPFRDEAKEFLRKKLIGKHVRVTIDGSKPASDGFEARDVATVTHGDKNIGLQLVQEGYCSVIRHRKDDTDRAPNYDELLAAQETAKEEKKGMWSGKAPKLKQYADMSENVQKAKLQLSTLSRQRKVPGIVDFCKSGSRFTVLIPREGAKLTLVLAGIRAPRASGRNAQEKGEPFGDDALDLANKRCNQRDCEIDVHDIDRAGGFIGDLYIGRESFAKVLVEEGFATVNQYSAEKSGNAAELLAAEKKAKEARKGMWHSWDPSQDVDEEAEAAPVASSAADTSATITERSKDYRDIVVTNIDAEGKIKVQEIGKGTVALTTLMSDFAKYHADPKNSAAVKEIKAGDYVAAKFTLDGDWYRARVRSNDRAAKVAEVVYIDYGNSEKQPWAKLRPLDAQFSVQKLKPQAIDIQLTFIQLPTSSDYLKDAINFIYEVTDGRQLVGSFDFVDSRDNVSFVTIFDPKSKSSSTVTESINREIIRAGHAMVPRKLKAWERSKVYEPVLKDLKEAESQAKVERLGMWEYGDITED